MEEPALMEAEGRKRRKLDEGYGGSMEDALQTDLGYREYGGGSTQRSCEQSDRTTDNRTSQFETRPRTQYSQTDQRRADLERSSPEPVRLGPLGFNKRETDNGSNISQGDTRVPMRQPSPSSDWRPQQPQSQDVRQRPETPRQVRFESKSPVQCPRSDNSSNYPKSSPAAQPSLKTPLSPASKLVNFSDLESLFKKVVESRGICYCLTETKKEGQYRIEVALNSLRVAYVEDSNLSLAKGMACLTALKSIDERLTQSLMLN
jgi:hypothetical protein